jgi:hypothetical protein
MHQGQLPLPLEIAQGRYVLEATLGVGGCATVYRATDRSLEVTRAIKVLDPNLRADSNQRERFLGEARIMARLSHPNILSVQDIGQHEGLDYFVMELCSGGSLADQLEARGCMPPTVAVSYVIQVLSALGAAHRAGVIHRDVKPQNVLLEPIGHARLADFGIALLTGEDALRSTRTGIAMGSLAYMAPEQRIDAKAVGPAADIYAAGTSLYTLLTNANPVDLFTAAQGSARWGNVPEQLIAPIQRAVLYDPAERYPSAQAMAAALAAILAELGEDPASAFLPAAVHGPTLSPGEAPHRDKLLAATQAAMTFVTGETQGAPPPSPAPGHSQHQRWQVTEAEGLRPVPTAGPMRRLGPVAALLGAAAVVTAGGLLRWQPWGSAQPGPGLPEQVEATEPAPATPIAPEAEEPQDAPTPAPPEDAVVDAGEPEPPSAAPAPPPTAQEPPHASPPAAVLEPPMGAWQGIFGGRNASLELTGSHQDLRGTLTVRFGSKADSTRVVGSYQPASRSLSLQDADPDGYEPGSYQATLSSDGSRLEGRFTTSSGGRVSLFTFNAAP